MSNAHYDQGYTIASSGELALQAALEGMIDRGGLGAVLEAIAAVCDEKAEHIRHGWQDQELARSWSKAATRVARAARDADRE